MKQNLYTSEDVLEVLAECAVGSDKVKMIEEYLNRQDRARQWHLRRLDEAYRIIGASVIDESVCYE